MYSVRLRGIYATALAAVLREHHWRIVQPTEALRPYVDLEDHFAPFDLEVRDREDRQGVVVFGDAAAVSALREVLFAELPDVICVPAPTELGAIYLGIVHKCRPLGYEIDLGGVLGFLPKTELTQVLKKGEVIRVQVKEITQTQAIVTTQLSLVGRFVVLFQQPGVGISKEITDPKERERLLNLGKKYCTNSWGVIWRTSAYRRDTLELQREIHILQGELPKLEDHPSDGIPGKLRPGQTTVLCEFPGGSKQMLEQWRARLFPESQALRQDQGWPQVGQLVFIEHGKVPSELNILWRGRVIATSSTSITVRREIKGTGLYDGLSILKEPGDYAVTTFHSGAWHYETRYYSRDGALKGIYVNINTPIEIYADRVRYVDLEIDVVRRPGEPAQIIDEPKLEQIAQYVSPRLVERVRAIAAERAQGLTQDAYGTA